ncbi:hypothetical protein [Parasitella parasitica]|uniref:Uncharacterized protein n=1 Tax=Parasitella parasitica TaxID=35722 RepID=A0A0B7N0I0_9FUNG|nr:hypothetical protein [Parasitella parasitica]
MRNHVASSPTSPKSVSTTSVETLGFPQFLSALRLLPLHYWTLMQFWNAQNLTSYLRDTQSKKRLSPRKKGKQTNQHGNTGTNIPATFAQLGDTNERSTRAPTNNHY